LPSSAYNSIFVLLRYEDDHPIKKIKSNNLKNSKWKMGPRLKNQRPLQEGWKLSCCHYVEHISVKVVVTTFLG